MSSKQGCIFCGELARKRTTVNLHLDQFVPEIAKTRRLKLLTDAHHHAAIIRHGRYADRTKWNAKNQPKQRDWQMEPEPLLRAVWTEFGRRMVVPIAHKGEVDHVARSWKHVDQTFWDEMACEAVQELTTMQDESLHEEHIALFVDNVLRDVEKMWKVAMDSDDSAPQSPSPSPEIVLAARKVRRTNINVDGDVHGEVHNDTIARDVHSETIAGDVITGMRVQSNANDRRQRSVFHTPQVASRTQQQRPASPGTPSVPIGILLSLRVLVLGSITVLVHLEQGTTLPEAIAEVVALATEAMPELGFYTVDRFVMLGEPGMGPLECRDWEDAWTERVWQVCVDGAQAARAPPKWGAKLAVRGVRSAHRE